MFPFVDMFSKITFPNVALICPWAFILTLTSFAGLFVISILPSTSTSNLFVSVFRLLIDPALWIWILSAPKW